MIAKFRLFFLIVQTLGLKWLIYRFYYAWALKLGVFRRTCPVADWDFVQQLRLKQGAISRVEDGRAVDDLRTAILGVDESSGEHVRCVAEAEEILRGCFSYYSFHKKDLGFPPLWNKNTFSGEVIPCDRHWSQIDDFSQGDIKNVWELSRFDWVFPFVRAYVRTKDAKYYEGFRTLLEDWMSCNAPNLGPHWKCGQEVALRIRALYFACIGFRGALASDDVTRGRLETLLYASASRIERNFGYALSQRSNHIHTELLGLLIAGLRFSDSRDGKRWLTLFEQHIAKSVSELNFESGGCCMYSMNYHRMMLDCMLLMVAVARENDYALPQVLFQRLGQAADFLYELIDHRDGRVPRFGSNDGARILPLSDAGYHDFRPLLQSLFWLTDDKRSLGAGPWDEPLAWLGASGEVIRQRAGVSLPAQKAFLDANDSGYVSIREGDLQLCVRVGPQKYRPGHLNHLSVLLKWRGQDILVDPGTYSYNAPAPYGHMFKETSLQNTVFVDNCSQMRKVGRFLSLPWIGSELIERSEKSIKLRFNGFPDLSGGATHTRSIVWSEDEVVVEDFLETGVSGAHGIHWLLPEFDHRESPEDCFRLWNSEIEVQIDVEGAESSELKHFVESSNGRWGYRSSYYQAIEPAFSIVRTQPNTRTSWFRTRIQLGAVASSEELCDGMT